jgi:acetylornithine/N-succinyldiaminopimelate aminotransferase
MVELVQGEGGVNTLDAGFVKAVCDLCREKDILLIVDEIQTGIGRTGKLFAYEHFGIQPDLVTVAKGLGGGLPIGGVLFRESCSHALVPGDHGTTFGGNPAVCAGAVEVMKRIDEEFLGQVAEKGDLMKSEIEKIEGVSEVTGLGMMVGVSLEGKDAKAVVKKALELGLVALTAKERIRLLPPLNITDEELKAGLGILAEAMKQTDSCTE